MSKNTKDDKKSKRLIREYQDGTRKSRAYKYLLTTDRRSEILNKIYNKLKSRTRNNVKTGCWEYFGYRDPSGYGITHFCGKTSRARRVMLMIHTNNIEPKLRALQCCNTSSCINPDHLLWGTHSDNMIACISKRRHSKLKHKHVIEIRKLLKVGKISQLKIAKKFEVTQATISNIKLGKYWTHI